MLELISRNRAFEGQQEVYSHPSTCCNGPMRFAIYRPDREIRGETLPMVTFLSGLTCTEENFVVKAGAQRLASALGLIILVPDTSPRGQNIPGEDDSYDFGSAAGFYLDATQPPWSSAYNMYSYVTQELPALVARHFNADMTRQGITGHSMGGHGALTLHLKNPETYKSVSAFAPIVAPSQVPWGIKAFSGYLGAERTAWANYDATELVRKQPSGAHILIDQGDEDPFLQEQLKPKVFLAACKAAGQSCDLRLQKGHDHSYFFISTFLEDHLKHHADVLTNL